MPRARDEITDEMIEAGARALHVDSDSEPLCLWRAREAATAVLVAAIPLLDEWAREIRDA